MIADFYKDFHQTITTTLETSEKASGERLLGVDPVSGRNVYAKLARYGAVVQMGRSNSEDTLSFAKLLPHQSIDTITFEEAMELFKLPRTVGTHNGLPLVVNIGRYGPYVQYDGKFYAVPKTEDLRIISLERCLEIMEAKKKSDQDKAACVIGEWEGDPLSVAVGRFGPYILYRKHFYALPKETDIHTVGLEQAKEVIRKHEEKNILRRFEEDEKMRILKGRFGAYISYNNQNYKLPKGSEAGQMTYRQCLEIVQTADQKTPGKTAKRKR